MNLPKLSAWGLLLLSFFQVFSYPVAHSAVTNTEPVVLHGGRVTFIGGVASGGCSVSISNTDKFVVMGEVRNNQFKGVGSDTQAVPFSIQLEECTSDVVESVAVSFSGLVHPQDQQVLAISAGPMAAQGIGVALFNADNQLLPVNGGGLNFITLNKGVNTLHFFAKYRMIQPDPSPGVANAQANFMLIYE